MKRTKKHYGGDYIPFFIFSMVLLWELYMVVPPTVEAQDQVRYLDSSHSTGIELAMSADAWFPKLLDQDTGVSYAIGSTAQATLLPIGPIDLMARARVFSILTGAGENLFYLGGAAGLGLSKQLSPRLSLRTAGFAGLGQIPDIKVPGVEEKSYGLYELGIRLEASYRLSASTRISLFTGFEQLATPTSPFIDAPSVGIGFEINPGEMLRSRGHISFREVDTEPVFPVLRSWYGSEPLGSVLMRNLEDGPIERVRVYFHVPEYMEGSRLCVSKERLERGEELEADLFAVFDERILALTENSSSNATVEVEYTYFGSERSIRRSFPLQVYHRNTMTWEDDRRAAAFVSPTDPAVLWFSRYAGSIARDRMRSTLPRNLQQALSIFEGLRLYGVNYVIDPNSSYIELSKNTTAIDFLQYPSETLTYRGGDCDDLSILYSSLLESSGISTAFITIPGHIYMAFDLGLSEEEAKKQFFDPGLLIFHRGRAWAPVEITMVQDGFVKAWRIGAKQWVDNHAAGSADFFPMRDNWAKYPPSALPNTESRFTLPGESEFMAAFDNSVNRFVKREIGPVIKDYENRLSVDRDPEILNKYGVALAKAGMLDEAWTVFAEAADEGYVWAWNNLASIAFIRREYKLAYSYYEWAESLLADDPVANLGMARAAYEMDLYEDSELLYHSLISEAPSLAKRFRYLQSVYGGTGRAWSMADRLTSTVWSEDGLNFRPAPAVAEKPVESRPARAPESQPSETPFPASEAEQEREPETPISEPVPEPERIVEEKAETEGLGESEPVLETELSQEPQPEPKLEPSRSPSPPPTIHRRAPEDIEIQQRAAEENTLRVVEDKVKPSPKPTVAPVTEPKPDPVSTSEPKPEPKPLTVPEPEMKVEVERESQPAIKLAQSAAGSELEEKQSEEEQMELKPDIDPLEIERVMLIGPEVHTPTGEWELEEYFAEMTDHSAYYAKLVLPSQPVVGPAEYRFKARSIGSGFAGFGIHIHGQEDSDQWKWRFNGFGGGDSILIWITSDPKHYGDAAPRLQIYRSHGEVAMEMTDLVKITGSVFELRSYSIAYDPTIGSIGVSVDGTEYLFAEGFKNPNSFDYILLRALDTAEFCDLSVQPLHRNDDQEEKRNE